MYVSMHVLITSQPYQPRQGAATTNGKGEAQRLLHDALYGLSDPGGGVDVSDDEVIQVSRHSQASGTDECHWCHEYSALASLCGDEVRHNSEGKPSTTVIARSWQCHCSAWHCYGSAVALRWQCLVQLQSHGTAMIMPWHCHGTVCPGSSLAAP